MPDVVSAIFALACFVGVVAWLSLAWNAVRVPLNLKPGISPWAPGNPFNYLFRTDALSPVGLVARRRAGLSLVVFLLAVAIGTAAGGLVKVWAP